LAGTQFQGIFVWTAGPPGTHGAALFARFNPDRLKKQCLHLARTIRAYIADIRNGEGVLLAAVRPEAS